MGLFPKDAGFEDALLSGAPRRMMWTRESGTRRLLTLLAIAAIVWFSATRVYDHFLLRKRWAPLTPSKTGLTLVGTLNARGNYDRNLFKIITANKASRVVLTEYGWKSVFDLRNGPLFDDSVGTAIEAALKQDDVTGYAMLTPFLRATVEKELGDPVAFKSVREEMPLAIPDPSDPKKVISTPLGALIRKYEGQGSTDRADTNDVPEAGSGSGHEQENVTTIPADTLIQVCPVVLTDAQFTEAWVEEVQGSLLAPTTYTVHLYLTPEGRSRFFQWSHDHENENVVLVLKGQVVAAPRITQSLDVSDFEINNLQDKKAAQAIADYMKHR